MAYFFLTLIYNMDCILMPFLLTHSVSLICSAFQKGSSALSVFTAAVFSASSLIIIALFLLQQYL